MWLRMHDGVGCQVEVRADPVGAVVLEPGVLAGRLVVRVEAQAVGGRRRRRHWARPARAILPGAVRLGYPLPCIRVTNRSAPLAAVLHGRGIGIWRVDLAHVHARGLGGRRDLVRPGRRTARRGAAHGTDHDDRLEGGLAGAVGARAVGGVRDVRAGVGRAWSARPRPRTGGDQGRDRARTDATATAHQAVERREARRGAAWASCIESLSGITGARPEGRT